MQEGGEKKVSDYLYTAGLEHKITELEAENAELTKLKQENDERIARIRKENEELKARISRCLEAIRHFVDEEYE